MDKYRKRRAVAVAHEMVDLLAEKGYITYYAENVEEARDKVLELIPKGASVGVGGSETLKAMDMINILRNGDYHFFDRYQEGLPFSEVEEIYRQALLADVFLTSSNAITRQGQLVNIDSSGNRVAAISYGPRKVIVVARGEQGCRYAGRRDEAAASDRAAQRDARASQSAVRRNGKVHGLPDPAVGLQFRRHHQPWPEDAGTFHDHHDR